MKTAPNRLIAEFNISGYGLRADSARPQRVSGSARTDSRRAESTRNPIALHEFGDDSALSAFTRTQWTAAFNSAHAQPGPGYPSVLVSLERMLNRLAPLRSGTAYHSRHIPTG